MVKRRSARDNSRMTTDPHFLRKKVTARLKELTRTPTEAAEKGGLKPDFIRDILRNRKRSVNGTNLEKLALALDWPTSELIDSDRVTRSRTARPNETVYVKGEVAAGAFIDLGVESVEPHEYEPSPFPPDPRYPTEAQFDLVVRGTSLNRFAREGQRIRCVTLEAYPHPVEHGEMVVVDRTRGNLRERTAKRFRQAAKDAVELWPDSDDPRWQEPIRVSSDGMSDDHVVEIIGIVLYVYDRPRR